MILLVDLCYKPGSLSRYEFVDPIARIVAGAGYGVTIVHYSEIRKPMPDADAVILCGTALADNAFLADPDVFSWITACSCPVLGICAGMQAIVRCFGGTITERCEIGMTDIRVTAADPLLGTPRTFSAYELHGFAVGSPGVLTVCAESACCIQAVRHPSRPVYGVMFHPEVRNEWVVEDFVRREVPERGPPPC
ncbi:MAG: glutamine amidotransferase [Methanomicrobiales archaeon]|nr:glutamine amidotransferase [Methanomicrobiales archaeon]